VEFLKLVLGASVGKLSQSLRLGTGGGKTQSAQNKRGDLNDLSLGRGLALGLLCRKLRVVGGSAMNWLKVSLNPHRRGRKGR